jgi:hypothetical protein
MIKRLLPFLLGLSVPLLFAAPALAEFGFLPGKAGFDVTATNPDGSPDLQAGSHPYELTTTFNLDSGDLRDVAVELPPGLVGNANAVPQCSQRLFYKTPSEQELEDEEYRLSADYSSCPAATAVGVEKIGAGGQTAGEGEDVNIYNLVPPSGVPAQFGFDAGDEPVVLTPRVRTGRDYGLTVETRNINQGVPITGVSTTFWGVPADPRHDDERGHTCLIIRGPSGRLCPANTAVVPLLTLPSSCGAPLTFAIHADSWQGGEANASVQSNDSEGQPAGLDGCNQLPFAPSLQIVPDGSAGSTPTGLNVDLSVPQEEDLNPTGLSEATVKDTTVLLPEGVVLNPAAADGLQACSEEQAGYEGVEAGSGLQLFSPGPVSCLEASKVGTVQIRTPLLPGMIEGAVYLAAQEANPYGSLVALYLVAEDPNAGVRIKLAGKVTLDEETGRVLTTFENTPPLPFEELKLEFFGTDRAPLGTPALCGMYTTEASIAPWSGNEPASLLAPFAISTGPNGSACSDPLPFNPSLTVGTTSIQAGGFSPFTMTMSREDGEQPLQGITLKMPKGVSGTLSSVKLCGEQQADGGTCSPESLIGETIVSVGVGGDPYTVRGGKVYITGPYKGAPFGLSIVNPAKAGPYNLGQVIVRAKLEVNEETAAITVTTDDEGPYKIPTIIDGIPLQIKHVNVNINRPGFTFNATNCNPLQITGDLVSTEGATSTLQVPYQVTNCAVLAFKPKLEASTSGKTSRSNGASLHVKLSYPAGPYDANIAKVKVELPKALPSRLTTLQKACTAQVFEANPAACPAASIVGHATATTPELPVPLTGPAYFVSHGGEAFPSLIIVLQGYGVTVHLVGSTFIDPAGVTSSTFKTVPDAPVGSFELTLPTGPYSALGTNKNLCKTKLSMPTEFLGQNGALIKTTTKIAVTGCGKVNKVSHKHRAKRAKHAKTGAEHAKAWKSARA